MASKGLAAARPKADDTARPRILVADDDEDILFLIGRLLERAGYDVVKAADGTEALRVARESDPDLLLLDVSMPGADGYAVCRELQAEGPYAPPVIFLTANAQTTARVSGLDAGAVDYITKPFEPAELTARVRAALRIKEARDALATEAARDSLTGLLNRSQLESTAGQLVSLARRHDHRLACLMIDLDNFKLVNDTYGHAAGDAVLSEVACRFRQVARATDVLFRYGGEEFVVLLPETDVEGALVIAERLRAALAAAPIVYAPDHGPIVSIPVRASVGLAAWYEGFETPAHLVAAADEAMYRAKALGRDRVEAAPSP